MASVFSRRFFKENFFDTVVDMAADPVPNVRMKMCTLCPILKRMIKLPDDAPLLKKLNTHVAHLKNDRDKDVSQVATQISEKLASIDTSRGEVECEDDLVDYKKEEEEEVMFRAEEKEIEESKKRDEEARSEFRRKLEQNEAEKVMRAKIFGTKHTNKPKPSEVSLKPSFSTAPAAKTSPSSLSPSHALSSSSHSLSPHSPSHASLSPSHTTQISPPFLPSVTVSSSSSSSTSPNGRPRARVVSASSKPVTLVTSTVHLRRTSDPQPKVTPPVKPNTLTPIAPSRERASSLVTPTKISSSLGAPISPSPLSASAPILSSSTPPPIKKAQPPSITKSRSLSTSSLTGPPRPKIKVPPL